METHNYRHKKFDVARQKPQEAHTAMDLAALRVKEELLSGNTSSRSYNSSRDEESSSCSSDYSLIFSRKRTERDSEVLVCSTPLPKRRRHALGEDSGVATTESSESSSSSSLPSPSSSELPKISADTLRDICKYHGNMVRKFPKKDRTPKDQERRNKNTIACRMSRRVKKLEHLAIEEQYKHFSAEHLKIVEQSMRATAYFNHLNELSKLESTKALKGASATTTKNFSIDYLMSGIKPE
ncbi:protein Mabiki [Scaptodrosophila lebanonensis]|uniref:Protein Mabiki n=1 Tax=Drosophila lebanonensis TaxID=7225 RepID=A0A6J2TKP9_DROLE|nr:protein Mabiki [Scaptodrosophila lebanonensis]